MSTRNLYLWTFRSLRFVLSRESHSFPAFTAAQDSTAVLLSAVISHQQLHSSIFPHNYLSRFTSSTCVRQYEDHVRLQRARAAQDEFLTILLNAAVTASIFFTLDFKMKPVSH